MKKVTSNIHKIIIWEKRTWLNCILEYSKMHEKENAFLCEKEEKSVFNSNRGEILTVPKQKRYF